MKTQYPFSQAENKLPAQITKAGSRQTYYTMRLLADRERVDDAMRAYAYFRWVDDTLDAPGAGEVERAAFITRQMTLLGDCYRGELRGDASPHEQMLVELVRRNPERGSGLATYLHNMMSVMRFDAERRGRLVEAHELRTYTHNLASAVTENLHYFIGHRCRSPHDETRYLAVSAAHITHMLRDTLDDIRAGYYNIPRQVLEAGGISPEDTRTDAYRAWVQGRVELARGWFARGRSYLRRVQNPRCRLAGFAYIARSEGVLEAIEREGYLLRESYPERKGLRGILLAAGSVFDGFLDRHKDYVGSAQTNTLREL
jgi:phytoene/squalene synthetase